MAGKDGAGPGDLDQLAAATLAKARDHLLGLQDPRGWWIGELETNVTMDAEDVLLRHFLGILTKTDAAETAVWIRSQQREDGTWANFYGGPGDLSTTVEAYVALKLAGDDPDAEHMKRAAAWITSQGGVTATRVFTRIWLALSGLWSWDDLPVIPPEIIYLPSWFPLNIYDWGCWARQTVVALAVVASFKPSNPLPFPIDELYARVPGKHPKARPARRLVRGVQQPRQGAAQARAQAAEERQARRAAAVHRLDHRPSGGRRLLGRYPAAVGVLDHGAAPDGLRPGQPGRAEGHRRP